MHPNYNSVLCLIESRRIESRRIESRRAASSLAVAMESVWPLSFEVVDEEQLLVAQRTSVSAKDMLGIRFMAVITD